HRPPGPRGARTARETCYVHAAAVTRASAARIRHCCRAAEAATRSRFEMTGRLDNAGPRRPLDYFVIIRLGEALGVCSAGEITNVTQAFHPSGRFWLANSQ